MATRAAGKTEDQLKKLAQAEMDAIRQRLIKRTTAAREYATAAARLDDANATWERIQQKASAAKAHAIADLIDTDMKPSAVAQLLGLDAKQLRAMRTAAPDPTSAHRTKTPASPTLGEQTTPV